MSCLDLLGLFSTGSSCNLPLSSIQSANNAVTQVTSILNTFIPPSSGTYANSSIVFTNGPGASLNCQMTLTNPGSQVYINQMLSATQVNYFVSALSNYTTNQLNLQSPTLSHLGINQSSLHSALLSVISSTFTSSYINSSIANTFNPQSHSLTNLGVLNICPSNPSQMALQVLANNLLGGFNHQAVGNSVISSALTTLSNYYKLSPIIAYPQPVPVQQPSITSNIYYLKASFDNVPGNIETTLFSKSTSLVGSTTIINNNLKITTNADGSFSLPSGSFIVSVSVNFSLPQGGMGQGILYLASPTIPIGPLTSYSSVLGTVNTGALGATFTTPNGSSSLTTIVSSTFTLSTNVISTVASPTYNITALYLSIALV